MSRGRPLKAKSAAAKEGGGMMAIARVALVVAVVIAGLFSATRVVAQVVAQNVAVPYAITYDNVLTGPSGKQNKLDPHVDEQRRNGDRAQLVTLADGNTKRIIEFVSVGLVISASTANSNISTMGKGQPSALIPNYTCRANRQPQADLVGKETLLGYPVEHYRTPGSSQSEDSQTTDTWVAGPELGCVILRRLAKFSGGSVDDQFATKVVAGDPPDADFALPANAVDLAPSQFENSLSSPRGGAQSVSRMDAVYYSHKAFREAAAAQAKPKP
jgi:hypothetical protein